MNYRKEIDGLRALSILPVIFFHFGFARFSGGYIGVDIFFVISGYLITSLIIREISEEKFSLTKFYERRARRILPLLFFVLFLSTIILPDFGLRSFINKLQSVVFPDPEEPTIA